MSINKAILIGNVGQEPRVRDVNGRKVASFTLATTERYTDRNGETRENTEWHNITCWDKLAEVVEKWVQKGSPLYIEGKITTRKWQDQEGNDRYMTEIVANNLQMLGKKSDNAPAQREDPQAKANAIEARNNARRAAQRDEQKARIEAINQTATAAPGPEDDLPF